MFYGAVCFFTVVAGFGYSKLSYDCRRAAADGPWVTKARYDGLMRESREAAAFAGLWFVLAAAAGLLAYLEAWRG